MKNAIFIVGGPGSGKDILIKSFLDTFPVQELTLEQVLLYAKKNKLTETILVKGNAYDINSVLNTKQILENHNYNNIMIFVEVDDETSKARLRSRLNITEETRYSKFEMTKTSISIYENIFDNFCVFDNNLDIEYQDNNILQIKEHVHSILYPIESITEKHIGKLKDYVYSRFSLDKDKIQDNKKKYKSFYTDTPIKPSGYNEYDIRTAGQSNVINYSESIDSPADLSSLTGMSINPGQDNPILDKVIVEPQKKKNKLNPRFNSPSKNESNTWKRAKKLLFKG